MDNQPKYIITLLPEVVDFIQSHAKITIESGGAEHFELNINLKHIEAYDFEFVTKPMRFFFIAFSAINSETKKSELSNLAFNFPGFPPLMQISEDIIPRNFKVKYTEVIVTFFMEFNNEQDFDDFITGYDATNQFNEALGQN